MKKIKKLALGLLVSVAAILSSVAPAVFSEDINASVTVVTLCGIEVEQNPINFGPVSPGHSSPQVSRTVKNTETSNKDECRYLISGTNWSGSPQMPVSQTKYKCVGGTGIDCDRPTFTALKGTPEDYLGLDAGKEATTTFIVEIPENQPSGTYQQTITITLNS